MDTGASSLTDTCIGKRNLQASDHATRRSLKRTLTIAGLRSLSPSLKPFLNSMTTVLSGTWGDMLKMRRLRPLRPPSPLSCLAAGLLHDGFVHVRIKGAADRGHRLDPQVAEKIDKLLVEILVRVVDLLLTLRLCLDLRRMGSVNPTR